MGFIADGMLGGLARWLRLAGYDTIYFSKHGKEEMLRLARKESRVILTRDRNLYLDNRDIAVFVESEGRYMQLKEVKQKLSLRVNPEKFFTRCSLCNCLLEGKNKSDISSLLPEKVRDRHDKFSWCPLCKRFYWEGGHCKEIRETLKTL